MWKMLGDLGVPAESTVLEPGCGTGNFIQAAPAGIRMEGVELDPTTAAIAGFLNPEAKIRNESFADTMLDGDGYDAVIGNVPFGQAKLHDSAYNEKRLSLHNHFIAKSLRMTKPGGVVAVMSSRYTLDSKSDVARREIAKYGEFLGAVRMPVGAHQQVAGTEAIVDVLVFKRHLDDAAPGEAPGWLSTVQTGGPAGQVAINEYFAKHPEQVLGDISTRNGRFGPELTVTGAKDPATIATQLEAGLDRVVAAAGGQVWDASGRRVTDRPQARTVQDPANVVGYIFTDESGNLRQNGIDRVFDMSVPKNAVAELKLLLELRDQVVDLLEHEGRVADDTEELAAQRTELNRVYDEYVAKYGPINRVKVTVKERAGKDPLIRRIYPAAVRALRDDPHFATVIALERYNEDTGVARKATVFEKRVVGAVREVTKVDNPEDAIAISLDRVGHVDREIIADLLDIEVLAVDKALGDRVFTDFDSSDVLIPAREFLSGDVRAKLREARAKHENDPRFDRHIEALEQVIPEELGPAQIDVQLGASWIPTDIVSEWVEHITKKPVKALERIDGEWKFKIVGKPDSLTESKWSVTGDVKNLSMVTVMKEVMNGNKLEVRYKPDPDSNYIVDTTATEALQQRAEELNDHFSSWLWEDAERSEFLKTRYNDLYNGIVLRSYDGVNLSFPGKAAGFTPYPHQHAAVARMIAEPSVGLFHEVGAGKTAEMVLGVMEMRRLGLVSKPAIVVPNQMLEQFTREFKQIYPRARVLSAGSEDLAAKGSRDGRQMFVARARTGDWDAVILTHSAFSRIGLGEAEAVYAREKLEEMQAVHKAKLDSELSRDSVKKLEASLQREEEKLKKMLDIKHDDGTSFDETGIDYLCIDEAHLFKNLTVVSSVSDLEKTNGSQRAHDLEMKLWYLREHLGRSRVATLATATPLPNNMIEMYVMMRYLRPDLLKAAEVYAADDWAHQFTSQVTAVELKPEGSFQVKTRTTQFRNLPELLRMWHIPGDVKTQADLQLDVPAQRVNTDGKRAPEMVIVPPTEAQVQGMQDLMERGKAVRDRLVQPEEDNMLKITANGRALALDPRLVDYDAPSYDEEVKLDVVARRVHEVYEATKDNEYLDEWGDVAERRGALQIVFSDLGTPSAESAAEKLNGSTWNVYSYLKEELVKKGIPEDKIRFIHDASNDQQKADLFQECRDGRVSVLIGSTGKMGVGTNIQARAVALHHVDAPWRPADVTQREGRVIRQKNQNDEVQIFRYATEGSFDAYMWGTLSRKAAFIEQVLSGRLDVREVDNSTEMALEFAEMQAVAAGDMRILERANLQQDLTKLNRNQKAHNRQITMVQGQLEAHRRTISIITDDLAIMEKYRGQVRSTIGDGFMARVKAGAYTGADETDNRARFGELLRESVGKYFDPKNPGVAQRTGFGSHNSHYPRPIAAEVEVGGIKWRTALQWNGKEPGNPMIRFHTEQRGESPLDLEVPYVRLFEGDANQVSRRFERKVNLLEDTIIDREQRVEILAAEAEEFRRLIDTPWAKRDEYESKMQRLDEITRELEAEAAPPPPEEPQQHAIPEAEMERGRHLRPMI